ncbi:MAG: cation transporter [Solirubrobacterales bacterium]|nr:cation transporter [Solirubrobacterales bacterium]
MSSDQAHSHDHSHQHSHGVAADASGGYLKLALALILAFMAGEVVAGVIASSLALLSDAAHMLTDAAALGLALVALRLAKRPPGGSFTYGLKRAEILSAQANGITLLVLAALILFEGVRRLIDPPDVEGGLVLAVALVGIPVNIAAAWFVSRANRRSLNVEGAFQHILTDLFAFIATAIAGLVMVLGGSTRADGVASLLVAGLMFHAAIGLLRESGRVFMEASPRGLDPPKIGQALAAAPGVVEVHDLHVWEVTSGMPALSAHVIVAPETDCHATRWRLARLLDERFGIDHTTLQVEHEATDELLHLEPSPKP